MTRLNPFVLPLCLFLSLQLPAQQLQDDFEGSGTITWVGDDCEVDDNFANPFVDPSNPSTGVMRYDDTGGQYANVRFDLEAKFDLSEFYTFSLSIYVPSNGLSGNQTNQVSLKLQNADLSEPWTTQTEIIKTIQLDQWQTLSFNFKDDNFLNLDAGSPDPVDRADLDRVLLQINGENNNDLVIAYIDDFSYDGEVTLPTPDPTYDRLIWSDEFDNGPSLDPTKWHHQTLLPNGVSWYNNEVQHYTNRLENSFVEDGNLHIRAIKESFTDQGVTKSYTSARLNSKFAFTEGRVEVRAKLPRGSGTWPAIWTLGKNIDEPGGFWQPTDGTVAWPACGEIDIMEHWGDNQNYVQSALHTPSSFGATVNHGGLMNPTASDSFHVYSMVWGEDRIRFYLDGFNFYTYEPETKNMDTWPFVADQYILLNVAMQGNIDPQFNQSDMVIDYVRVFGPDDPGGMGSRTMESQFHVYPNPSDGMVYFDLPPSQRSPWRVDVITTTGQLVKTVSASEQQFGLDTTTLNKGAYLVHLSNGSERLTSSMIVQ